MIRNTRSKPFSDINVTPFVDVMLVLLIIFMVTAPLLTVGVQVDLPESKAITENRFDTKIYVRGDEAIDYGKVMRVLGELSGSGFSKVSLITKPISN